MTTVAERLSKGFMFTRYAPMMSTSRCTKTPKLNKKSIDSKAIPGKSAPWFLMNTMLGRS